MKDCLLLIKNSVLYGKELILAEKYLKKAEVNSWYLKKITQKFLPV